MPHSTTQTWLQKLDEQLNVDVDWMDPSYSKSLPIRPNDQTSNNLWVNQQMSHPENKEMVLEVCKDLKAQGWKAAYTRIAVNMCKNNIGNIKGRVLLQVYPNEAYDTQAVLASARAYAKEFERAGIAQNRYCIKIPCTGPALVACPTLKEEGIATLGTALFGLPQAIAASQAKCLYISPYFNEVKAHDDLKLWPDVKDPATQHTMSARTMQILETYARLYRETGQEQPLLKQASFITPQEAMAAGEHGCHSATISPQVLDELAKLQYDGTQQPGEGKPKPSHVYANYQTPDRLIKVSKVDPLLAADIDAKLASTEIDYLANGGEELEKAINADPVTKQRLADALELFTGGLLESKAKIEAWFEEV
ncbi:aldolase [Hortaea werneckii]|nr:aldolase [Hortaea werneckii]KAI7564555.1 aldolase [Hortaea werneckii]KAI7621464.1 aldolase [Hortaea werneckii]KAI7630563.1 aldolase [Hortaea werneckii]KAI7678118.1 aldolase [Hortaea werneckii]